MKYAVVFPGQGSQSTNMLAELASAHNIVNDTYAAASDVLGYDLANIIYNNPDDQLDQTVYTQPAMLAAGVAVWRIWQQHDLPAPTLLAGHSLGEYSALVAGQSLAYSDAVQLVAQRAELMQAAIPVGEGAMAAILGLDDTAVRQLCEDSAKANSGLVVEAVNFNSPGQVVIAGHTAAVEHAVAHAAEAGAKRAIPLPVSVPSHSSLMLGAAEALYKTLQAQTVQKPVIPVLQNIDAKANDTPDAIRQALKAQLHNPVLWTATVENMVAMGVDTIFEFGPGKVLASLVKRIHKPLTVVPVESASGLEKAITAIQGE